MSELDYDQRGFVPGVSDTLESLVEREETAKAFLEHIQSGFDGGGTWQLHTLQYTQDQVIPTDAMTSHMAPATEHYDIVIDWVPGFYSNQGLSVLWGGFAMGFEDTEGIVKHGANFSLFQLRDAFRYKPKWLIYSREELISHEMCHIARMGLGSRVYEEMFAYRISSSGLRRYLGPIFRSSKTMIWVLVCLGIFWLAQLSYALGVDAPLLQWLGRLPFIGIILFGLGINQGAHNRFNRALKQLVPEFADKAEAVLFRLTDEEIDDIAGTDKGPQSVSTYLKKTLSPLRWAQITRYIHTDIKD